MTRGYEVVAAALVEQGVEAFFGVMGEGNLDLVAELVEVCGVRYYAVRHEAAAVGMAEGYARSTGRVGVATVTHGPGLANTVTTLTAAVRDRSAVVVLAGDIPEAKAGHVQKIDQAPLVAATGATFRDVADPEDLPGAVAEAFARTVAEARPVVLNISTDVYAAECSGTRRPPPPATVDVPVADPDALARAVALLGAARRPVILAGQGAARAGAEPALRELGEQTGALLATSLLGKGLFAGDPASIGTSGGFGHPLTRELLEQADCVAAFGASLNMWTTKAGSLFGDAAVIHCDADPRAAGGATVGVDCRIVGDARAVAEALTERLRAAGEAPEGYRTGEVLARVEAARTQREFAEQSTERFVDPRTLCVALDEVLPANRTLVVDGGHFMGFPCRYIAVPDPQGFVFAVGFGSIGLALATAVGTGIGRPDRTTVAVVGDGGLMMSLPELETAARYRVPMVIVVMNDDAYGAEVHHLELRDIPEDLAVFDNPDFAQVARSLGADGITVRSEVDLDQLGERCLSLDRPLVVDAKINRRVVADWFTQLTAVHAQPDP